jgi:hypothetical protein
LSYNLVNQGAPSIDLAGGHLPQSAQRTRLSFTPAPDFVLELIGAGGIYPLLTRMAQDGRLPKR